jgi:hypothetical protein
MTIRCVRRGRCATLFVEQEKHVHNEIRVCIPVLLGLFYVFSAALSSCLGANAGLLALRGMMGIRPGCEQTSRPSGDVAPVAPIRWSIAWIAAGAIASLLFISVLGRGLTWSPSCVL